MLVFEEVTKQFSEDSYGVQEVSFTVNTGEFVFVTGPSGSGKTTLMRLITKEYTPTSGDIFFEDYSISKLKNSQLHHHRRKIGVVFQDYCLLPELNIWENIGLPLMIANKSRSEVEERVTDLLKLIELTDKAQLFPSQLSGGELQRIAIARALSTGPSIIFADEPTGNLDRETSLKIARLLKKINELGTSIIFATHDNEILRELSEVRKITLDKGKLLKDSKPPVQSKPDSKLVKVEQETNEQAEEDKELASATTEKKKSERKSESKSKGKHKP